MNDKIKDEINKILAEFLGEEYLLFVFGSFARGENDRVSDLDLALYKAEKYLLVKLLSHSPVPC